MNTKFSTKTIVATGLGAAVFLVLFMYVKIPSPVPATPTPEPATPTPEPATPTPEPTPDTGNGGEEGGGGSTT